jgi:hypothetical protein
MAWLVSGARLEDAQKEIRELKAERERLLNRIALMTGHRPIYGEPPAETIPVTSKPAPEENDGVVPFKDTSTAGDLSSETGLPLTPFDRIGTNFDRALRLGKVPARFRARMH